MPTPNVTWAQALAWRMRRHYLDPVGDRPLTEVVRRLCGIQAQVASSAELCVRVRRATSKSGEVARALREGRLIKTWAMRGTLHLLTPEDAGAFLALLAAGRSWERPAWEQRFGLGPAQIEALRGVVREALAERPLTREEMGARGRAGAHRVVQGGWAGATNGAAIRGRADRRDRRPGSATGGQPRLGKAGLDATRVTMASSQAQLRPGRAPSARTSGPPAGRPPRSRGRAARPTR